MYLINVIFELAHLEILRNTITLNACTDMKNDAMLLNSVTRTTATHGEFQYDYVVNIWWWGTYMFVCWFPGSALLSLSPW